MCIEGVTGLVASLTSPSSAEWEWGSMMPGVSQRPVASTTVAELGAETVAPTPAIFPACTQTTPCSMVPWLAVMTVAPRKTISAGGDCWACARIGTIVADAAMSTKGRRREGGVWSGRRRPIRMTSGQHEDCREGRERHAWPARDFGDGENASWHSTTAARVAFPGRQSMSGTAWKCGSRRVTRVAFAAITRRAILLLACTNAWFSSYPGRLWRGAKAVPHAG